MNTERIETLRKLLEMEPTDVFSRYALGLEYLAEQPEVSEQCFLKVLELDPNYVAAYFQLGQLKAEVGRNQEAADWLERGIEVAGRVGDSHALAEMQDFLDQL